MRMALTFVAAGLEPSGVTAEFAVIRRRASPDGLRRSAMVDRLFHNTLLSITIRGHARFSYLLSQIQI